MSPHPQEVFLVVRFVVTLSSISIKLYRNSGGEGYELIRVAFRFYCSFRVVYPKGIAVVVLRFIIQFVKLKRLYGKSVVPSTKVV